jgi:hypothetical protein
MKRFVEGQKLLCVKGKKELEDYWHYPRLGSILTYGGPVLLGNKDSKYRDLVYTHGEGGGAWPKDAFISLPDEIDRKVGK